jgi:hypothetical protein
MDFMKHVTYHSLQCTLDVVVDNMLIKTGVRKFSFVTRDSVVNNSYIYGHFVMQ